MNQGGRASQKNTAVDQKQYPGEAVGTRNICKTKEWGKKRTNTNKNRESVTNGKFERYGRIYRDACDHISIF